MSYMKNISQLNNKSMEPGQTLFQYLKRKKHIELTKSLQNSFRKTSLKPEQSTIIKQSQIAHKDLSIKQSSRQTSTKRRHKKSSNKKKRGQSSVDSRKENYSELSNLCQNIFKDEKTTRRSLINSSNLMFEQKVESVTRKTPARSFMSMISPLKNQVSLSLSQSKAINLNTTQERRSLTKMTEFASKKLIKQTMSKVQKHFLDQVDFEKEMKEKLRQFFIMSNSIFVQLQDLNEDWITNGVDKKIKQLRANMKLINGFVTHKESKQKDDITEMIDSLYVSINQVLDSYEGQVKSQSQETCQLIVSQAKQQYQQQIEKLKQDKNSLNREIGSLKKQNSHLQKEYNKLLKKINDLKQQGNQNAKNMEIAEQEVFEELQQKFDHLSVENNQLREKIHILQKKLKGSEYKFEEYFRKVNLEHQQKLNQRESYLLKQINLLKSECAKDINSLNQYYTNRDEQYPKRIKELEQTISDQTFAVQKLEKTLKQSQNIIHIQQVNFNQAKRKNEQILVDLYRINQELYKHWIALKDIKTLLTRLGMFSNFERIYKDIPFDQVLFFP